MWPTQPYNYETGPGSQVASQSTGFNSSWAPGVFYTYFYNHAHRPRLEKLLYIELYSSRSSNGYFKPLLDPGGSFNSETAARRFQKKKYNGYTGM
jgi:hypothetical protein